MRLTGNRYDEIERAVVELFKENRISKIPIDPFDICERLGINLVAYSSLNIRGQSETMKISKDGFCLLLEVESAPSSEQWFIFYNDNTCRERIRFTIMHEIGHIVLAHTQHSELAESEANFFAKYALAPPPLVYTTQPEDYVDLAEQFDLSQEFAYNAMEFYNKWLRYGGRTFRPYETRLIRLFQEAG